MTAPMFECKASIGQRKASLFPSNASTCASDSASSPPSSPRFHATSEDNSPKLPSSPAASQESPCFKQQLSEGQANKKWAPMGSSGEERRLAEQAREAFLARQQCVRDRQSSSSPSSDINSKSSSPPSFPSLFGSNSCRRALQQGACDERMYAECARQALLARQQRVLGRQLPFAV